MLNIETSALVLVDLQLGLCGGVAGAAPTPLTHAVEERGVLAAAARALKSAREASLTVVHVRLSFAEGYGNRTNRTQRFDDHEAAGRFASGSEAVDFCEPVRPQAGELVFEKGSVSPFASTALETVLHGRGIRTLFVGGVATHLAVESAARDGGDRGFEVVVLEDLCAAPSEELHAHAVGQTIPAFGEVISVPTFHERLGAMDL